MVSIMELGMDDNSNKFNTLAHGFNHGRYNREFTAPPPRLKPWAMCSGGYIILLKKQFGYITFFHN